MRPLPSLNDCSIDGSSGLPNLSVAWSSVGTFTAVVTVRNISGSDANAMPSSGMCESGSLMVPETSACRSVGARWISVAAIRSATSRLLSSFEVWISFAAMARSLLDEHSDADIISSRSTTRFGWRQKGGVVLDGRRSTTYRPRDKGLSHSAVSGFQAIVKSSSVPSQVRLTPSVEGSGFGSRKKMKSASAGIELEMQEEREPRSLEPAVHVENLGV